MTTAAAKKTTYKITNYRANGEIQELIQDQAPTLEQLQKLVGGYIESVPSIYYIELGWFTKRHKLPCDVWCDEDGRYKVGYGPNPHFRAMAWGGQLYGDVTVVDTITK